jgi:hypothetical protein
MPSLFRTSTGTEIWPCAVTFDCAIVIILHYPGNASPSICLHVLFGLPNAVVGGGQLRVKPAAGNLILMIAAEKPTVVAVPQDGTGYPSPA